jgi:hypothetical protein
LVSPEPLSPVETRWTLLNSRPLFHSFVFVHPARIQLHNFLLAIAAPSRSLAPAISGCNLAQAAVGAGDDGFLADDFSERNDAIGHQFRMLDEIGGVADNTRSQDLPSGEFHVAPDFELSQEKTPDPFSTRLIIDLLCTVGEKQDRILFSFRYKIIKAFLLQLVK